MLLLLLLLTEFPLDSPHLDALNDIQFRRVRVLALLLIELLLLFVVFYPIDATLFLVVVFLRLWHSTPILLNQFHDLLRVEGGVLLLDYSPGVLTVEDKRRQGTLRGLSRGLAFLVLVVRLLGFVCGLVRGSVFFTQLLGLFRLLVIQDFLFDILTSLLSIMLLLLFVISFQIFAFLTTF